MKKKELKTNVSIERDNATSIFKRWISKITLEKALFFVILLLFESCFFFLYFGVVKNGQKEFVKSHGEEYNTTLAAMDQGYDLYFLPFIEVSIMVFMGFGLLMAFYKTYGYSAIAISFLVTCFAAQYALFIYGFLEKLFELIKGEEVNYYLTLDLKMMIKSILGAGSVVVSMGAIIGKTNPFHLIALVVVEVPFYSINSVISNIILEAWDNGGTMTIFIFASYFGLLCAWIGTSNHNKNKAELSKKVSHTGNFLSLIGSIILFVLWPAFNCALEETYRHRSAINTFCSLIASSVTSFITSRFINSKFNLSDIQIGGIAGGICIGSSSMMTQEPGSSVLVGMVSGFVTSIGNKYINPLLKKLGLHDSCGLNNLAMNGLLGGIFSIFAAMPMSFLDHHRTKWGNYLPLIQLACLCSSITFAIVGGSLMGLLIRFICPLKENEIWDDSYNFNLEEFKEKITKNENEEVDLKIREENMGK